MLLSVLGTSVAKSCRHLVHNLIQMWSWAPWAPISRPISRSQHRGTSRIDMHSVSALCTWVSWARLSRHVSQSIGWLCGLSLLIATALITFCYSSRFPPLGSGFFIFVVKPMENLGFCPPDGGPFWGPFWSPVWARFGVHLGSILGVILGPFWGSFWVYFGTYWLCDRILSYHMREYKVTSH